MNFLKKLLAGGCSHRFSWPRVDAHGRHYQNCLLCGTSYEYDWRLMRRIGRPLVGKPAWPPNELATAAWIDVAQK